MSRTNPDHPADDREILRVGVVVLDSVAWEQYPTNTARFDLTQRGALWVTR